jgi:hypothetical protein
MDVETKIQWSTQIITSITWDILQHPAVVATVVLTIALSVVWKLTVRLRLRRVLEPRSNCCGKKVDWIQREGNWLFRCKRCREICEPLTKKGG